jgi:hypothetical protein
VPATHRVPVYSRDPLPTHHGPPCRERAPEAVPRLLVAVAARKALGSGGFGAMAIRLLDQYLNSRSRLRASQARSSTAFRMNRQSEFRFGSTAFGALRNQPW